jgi:hypothetical protein
MATEKVLNNSSTALNSIDVSKNAKNEYAWSIKLYFMENDGMATIKKVVELNKELRKQFLGEK